MKANEFVKLNGWSSAKYILNHNQHKEWVAVHLPNQGFSSEIVSIDDLKRLVESHELVVSKGGLVKCKEVLARDNFTWCSGSRVYTNPLEIAVADVESCKRLEVGDGGI